MCYLGLAKLSALYLGACSLLVCEGTSLLAASVAALRSAKRSSKVAPLARASTSRAERIQAATRMAALLVASEEKVGLDTARVQEATGSLLHFINTIK